MGMTWTDDQKKVIELRDRNILVSAAAGSGKTAVLVERIIKIITDKERPVDIDRLLIVTFTNAAAAEMRERIGNALENALKDQPDDEHLQRQLSLLHNAQITTIDSFCLYVIRNHFHEIDLEPNFRIGDEGELKLLKEDVLAKVLLKNYEVSTPEFLAFVDGYASGRFMSFREAIRGRKNGSLRRQKGMIQRMRHLWKVHPLCSLFFRI